MRILKSHPLLKMVNSYVIDSPQPSNISYLWNFGSLLGVCLIKFIRGVRIFKVKNSKLLQASTNKLILLSIILSSNGNCSITVIDPVYLLNYVNTIISKISVSSFISLSSKSSYIGYNKISMFTPKLFSSTFSNTIGELEFIDLESRMKMWSSFYSDRNILELYNFFHNHQSYMLPILAIILYRALPYLRNSVYSFYDNIGNLYSSQLRYLSVYMSSINNSVEINQSISEIDRLISQLRGFIDQFNNLIIINNINVIQDVNGDLSFDVPANMEDELAQRLGNRIDLINSLIHDRVHELESLFEVTSQLDNYTNFSSIILAKKAIFNALVSSYPHI